MRRRTGREFGVHRPDAGPGDRFQCVQGGNGIDKTLTDSNKFRLSPRLSFAYDLTGRQSFSAARSGVYDRPRATRCSTAINLPGMQVSQLQWGLASQIGGGATGYNAPVNLNPNVYDWKTPTVYQWNLGVQMRLPAAFVLDVAYVGSESRNLLQFRNLNAIDYGAAYTSGFADPTRGQSCSGCSGLSSTPGGNALAQDFLRPYQGYGNIRLWEFEAYSDYKALQTTVSRRFQRGLMFNFNYTRSEAKGSWAATGTTRGLTTATTKPTTGRCRSTSARVGQPVYQSPRSRRACRYLVNDSSPQLPLDDGHAVLRVLDSGLRQMST
jgi:hypothetical protein